MLALDLGTICGFAIYKKDRFISGTKKFRTYKEKFGERFLEFRNWLLQMIATHDIRKVYFERVYGHVGTEAAHCYGGFLYTLAAICLEKNITCTGFTVQAIKKFMTGKGNATKDEMISATRRFGFNPETDDEADAISIILLALKDLNIDCVKLANNDNGSFQTLIESERQAPDISLASEFF